MSSLASNITPEIRLGICVTGIYSFYMFYGVLQERIFKMDEQGDRFDNTLFLLFVQCSVNLAVALVGLTYFGKGEFSKPFGDEAFKSPLRSLTRHSGNAWLAFISACYMGAMFASNQALQHVNYPAQVLGKSCKMIPVMLFNVLIGGHKYSTKEYLCVLSITVGIVLFNFGGKPKKGGQDSSLFGLGLLFTSLIGDGLTSSNQRLFRDEYAPSTHALMMHMNMWSTIFLGSLLVVTGEGLRGLAYCMGHPALVKDILIFSTCSALGQNFIFYTITGPGPLACTTITTTRKFFTILVSVLLYPENSLSTMQWGAVLLVFLGLSGELQDKYAKQQRKKNASKPSKGV